MSMAEDTSLAVEMGRLQGRLDGLQDRIARGELQGDANLKVIYDKLDAISKQLNTGAGGLKAGLYLSHVAAAVVAFLVAHFWPAKL